jgi:hypothetical protein
MGSAVRHSESSISGFDVLFLRYSLVSGETMTRRIHGVLALEKLEG